MENTLIKKRIAGGVCLLIAGTLFKDYSAVCFLMTALLLGYDTAIDAVKNIFRGDFLDENFLMLVAVIGSIFSGQYREGAMVMLLFRVGEAFEESAVSKSRDSIKELMAIMPEHAWLAGEDGTLKKVDPEDVKKGDLITIKAGEKIPLDGVVIKGTSFLDTKAITGESLPRKVSAGDKAISGCVNKGGLLLVRVTHAYEESTVARILEMVEEASDRKAKAENFITGFARWYTPLVVVSAVLLSFVPPLLGYGPVMKWVKRALVFLVVSCPCALVISVPLTFFGGIGAASKRGILIKGSNFVETLSKLQTVVFDKTGTLTEGVFGIADVRPEAGITKEELLKKAASLEEGSSHPLAGAFHGAAEHVTPLVTEEISGKGLRSGNLLIGSARFLREEGISVKEETADGVPLYVAEDGKFLGTVLLRDSFKDGADKVAQELKKQGVKKMVILSGDKEAAAKKAGAFVGADLSLGGLLPEDKKDRVEALLHEGALAFVGDGINDAPVLTRSDVGIAMGKLGSAAAIEAADVVLMDDDPVKVADAIRISKKTIRIVRENIIFALSVKFGILILASLGRAGMGLAVFGDVGVAMIAILNAMRMLTEKNKK